MLQQHFDAALLDVEARTFGAGVVGLNSVARCRIMSRTDSMEKRTITNATTAATASSVMTTSRCRARQSARVMKSNVSVSNVANTNWPQAARENASNKPMAMIRLATRWCGRTRSVTKTVIR